MGWWDSVDQRWKPVGYTSPLTTSGDVLWYDGFRHRRLALGSSGQVITANAGQPVYAAPNTPTATGSRLLFAKTTGDVSGDNISGNAAQYFATNYTLTEDLIQGDMLRIMMGGQLVVTQSGAFQSYYRINSGIAMQCNAGGAQLNVVSPGAWQSEIFATVKTAGSIGEYELNGTFEAMTSTEVMIENPWSPANFGQTFSGKTTSGANFSLEWDWTTSGDNWIQLRQYAVHLMRS